MGNYPDGVSQSDFYDYSERKHDRELRERLFIDSGDCRGDSLYDSWRDCRFDRASEGRDGRA
ncbi:MAG: hypothetical protein IKL97_06590 [Eggerthellaceae bacterium]|nr:hypothetical protein [Eggerthellaceae bacterium]